MLFLRDKSWSEQNRFEMKRISQRVRCAHFFPSPIIGSSTSMSTLNSDEMNGARSDLLYKIQVRPQTDGNPNPSNVTEFMTPSNSTTTRWRCVFHAVVHRVPRIGGVFCKIQVRILSSTASADTWRLQQRLGNTGAIWLFNQDLRCKSHHAILVKICTISPQSKLCLDLLTSSRATPSQFFEETQTHWAHPFPTNRWTQPCLFRWRTDSDE